jgi:hypothetical protein
MKTHAVSVHCDVICEWKNAPPRYRLFVNNELFMERTFIWTDHYLEEVIPIEAPPGNYQIRYELLGSPDDSLRIKNARVHSGPGVLHKNLRLEIQS